jgi:hypothetical protein
MSSAETTNSEQKCQKIEESQPCETQTPETQGRIPFLSSFGVILVPFHVDVSLSNAVSLFAKAIDVMILRLSRLVSPSHLILSKPRRRPLPLIPLLPSPLHQRRPTPANQTRPRPRKVPRSQPSDSRRPSELVVYVYLFCVVDMRTARNYWGINRG